MEQKKIDRIVEVDLAADLLADTVLGAALNSAALQGLQGGANGFLLIVVVEVLLLLRSQRVSIGVFSLDTIFRLCYSGVEPRRMRSISNGFIRSKLRRNNSVLFVERSIEFCQNLRGAFVEHLSKGFSLTNPSLPLIPRNLHDLHRNNVGVMPSSDSFHNNIVSSCRPLSVCKAAPYGTAYAFR